MVVEKGNINKLIKAINQIKSDRQNKDHCINKASKFNKSTRFNEYVELYRNLLISMTGENRRKNE